MGAKIQADEISSIIKERIDNFELNVNDTSFNTDVKWRDILETLKSLENSNEILKSYLDKALSFNTANIAKLIAEIRSMISKNDEMLTKVSNTCFQKTSQYGDIVLENDGLEYLKMVQELENVISLSKTVEVSTNTLLTQYKKEK